MLDQDRADDKAPDGRNEALTNMFVIATFVGVFALLLNTLQFWSWAKFCSVASTGLLAAGASFLAGGLIGFISGIPRTLQGDSPTIAHTGGQAEMPPEGATPSVIYRANTNLEQISDWLTKILVGAGLTQLAKVPSSVAALARDLAPAVGGSPPLAVGILLYFLFCGFFLVYLWTRLWLPGALREADLSVAIEKRFVRVERKLDVQAQRDAAALSLLQRQLHPGPGSQAPRQEELDQSIAAASPQVKVQVFFQAQQMRWENWRTDKEKVELTVPVFRALIADDKEGRFHRNHAQLGYALKDKPSPDWAGAEAELTKAIEMRGPADVERFRIYEFNRAVCRIMFDHDPSQGIPSAPAVREKILSDLKVAAVDAEIRAMIVTTGETTQLWMALNNVTGSDL